MKLFLVVYARYILHAPRSSRHYRQPTDLKRDFFLIDGKRMILTVSFFYCIQEKSMGRQGKARWRKDSQTDSGGDF
jgi:hypothetical protein